MREILFKAKEIDSNEWVEGFYKQCKFHVRQKEIGHWIESLSPIGKQNENYLIDPNTLCQFTGLLDKNGNKIFEGDEFDYNNEIRYVEYIEDRCCYVLKNNNGYDTRNCVDLDCDLIYQSVITSNIHDK